MQEVTQKFSYKCEMWRDMASEIFATQVMRHKDEIETEIAKKAEEQGLLCEVLITEVDIYSEPTILISIAGVNTKTSLRVTDRLSIDGLVSKSDIETLISLVLLGRDIAYFHTEVMESDFETQREVIESFERDEVYRALGKERRVLC